MDKFNKLVNIVDQLLGPKGCPWDQEQTLSSMRSSLIEESYELVEAIDAKEKGDILEELGDLLFLAIFLCRLAEKEKFCTLDQALEMINEKLVRRHPHVFGDVKVSCSKEVLKQWAEIKSKEANKSTRKHLLDGIPKDLPALAAAKKVYAKLAKTKKIEPPVEIADCLQDESALGKLLFSVVGQASENGLDAECALKNTLRAFENKK